jgi:chromosome segregation ATPase
MKGRQEPAMSQGDKSKPTGKKLEERFAIVEQRIRALLDENGALAARVEELERELAQARNAALNLEEYQGKAAHIRRKVETVLQSLESIAPVKKD